MGSKKVDSGVGRRNKRALSTAKSRYGGTRAQICWQAIVRRRPGSGEHRLRASERKGVVLTEAHAHRSADKRSGAEDPAAESIGYEPANAKESC